MRARGTGATAPQSAAQKGRVNSPKSTLRGLRRLTTATGFSAAGFLAAWRHEEPFRQEFALTMALTPLALCLGENMLRRAILTGSRLLMLIVELLKFGVEATVDRIGHDHHALSAQAKDMRSAAVLISLLLAGAVWLAVAWDRFA